MCRDELFASVQPASLAYRCFSAVFCAPWWLPRGPPSRLVIGSGDPRVGCAAGAGGFASPHAAALGGLFAALALAGFCSDLAGAL